MADTPTRKLAVILHADVVGSTSLVRSNETVTHERIRDVFRRFSEMIQSYNGIAHEIRGDALVAEFAKVSDAISASLAFQAQNAEHNDTLADQIRPVVRVGIAMGEVVVADNTVTGEGVVLAQRLEQLADGGGLCIQGAAYETVPKRLPFIYESLGEHQIKGFNDPIRGYTVSLEPGTSVPQPDVQAQHKAATTPELPDKPSIAVLPFTNMSGEREQEYFSDGITEDIITELSRFRSLFVIARNSTFAYRGEKVDVKRVGRELGVQYVVEGSVRKAGQRVRISAQLIEAANGKQKWAERYDRDLEDIFSVQDEVAQTIVSILPGRLDDAAFERTRRKPTESMTAYDYVLRGIKAFKHMTRGNCLEAGQMYAKAIELDPEYARAYTLLASTYIWSVFMEWSTKEVLDKAMECCEKALLLDDNDSWAHAGIGFVMFLHKQDVRSENHFQRAMMLNPNDPDIAAFWADVLVYLGRWEEALDWINKAKRLNPFHPEYYDWYRALALYSAQEYEQAEKSIKEMMNLDRWHHAYLAASCAHMNRLDEAHSQIKAFVDTLQKEKRERGEATSSITLASAYERANRYRNPSDREHFLDGLRKAGLRE